MSISWRGTFISGATASRPDDPAVYFRRDVIVARPLRRAVLHVTALGIVVPHLNGERIGDDVLRPGWTSYRHRLQVSSYDVTDKIRSGANTLAAVVGEGWAVGPLTWENRRANYADRPALYLQLDLEHEDGTDVISTDERFRVGEGGVRANGLYAGEIFDARLEPEGWDRPGFDDSRWAPAELFQWNLETLIEQVAPPIRRIEELSPVAVRRTDAGTIIVDFGQNISGWIRLQVSGDAGTTITLRHAEVLTPDGALERETNRSATATDQYKLRGAGLETWEPEFTFHGFRYVEVDGWPGEVHASALRAVVVHSDMTRTGWFETSDPLINRLHENTVWSMRDNFVGVPTDCPQRDERLGWTGDLNAFTPTATYLYDVRGVLTSWLQDLAAEQLESGTVPWTVPDVLPTPSSATAVWSDVAVSLPWALYEEYGDASVLRTSWPSMTSFMDEVEAALDDGGLWSRGFQFGDWLDPDAPADNPAGGKTDRYLVASAYLVKSSREMLRAAEVLDETAAAEHFRQLHCRVREAFRREFVTENGRLVSETATAYALAIQFEILDADQLQKAGDRLAEVVAAADFRISTGFAGTPLLTDALTSTGHLAEAYRLLLQTECPSFLYPVAMGATTIWERWDSVLPDGTLNSTGMTSLNHYALGAVADWLHRVVGGLTRTAPGWRTFRIAPQPGGGLTRGRATHDTVHGRAEVAWRIEDGDVVVEAVVPAGTIADVVLPLHPDDWSGRVSEGAHSWRYPAPNGYGRPVELTMDTPLSVITDHGQVWAAVREVFRAYFPGIPIDAGGSHMGEMSLNAMLERLPGVDLDMEPALRSALTTGGAE